MGCHIFLNTTPNPSPKTMRRSSLLLFAAALISGLLTAPATIIPYSWQRFDVALQPGLDATGQNHIIRSGFGGGEAPNNSLPIADNVCVGGPLGPDGLF